MSFDGFNRWITKRGISGQKAREVAKKYREIQSEYPQMTPVQIAHQVINIYTGEARHPDDPVSLGLLVKVLVDVAQEGFLIGKKNWDIVEMEKEVVEQELTKMGLPMHII